MRVAYASHSLVAHRQRSFGDALAHALKPHGVDVEQVYPRRWAAHERDGGYDVDRPGDMVNFRWPDALFEKWTRDAPSVVLIQNEAYCASAIELAVWCSEHRVPYVTFSWENANAPPTAARWVYRHAAHNVFGNSEARRLAEAPARWPPQARDTPASSILPQVGIDDALFRPMPRIQKKHDVLFCGRSGDPMKGEAVLDQACVGAEWRVAKGHELGFARYDELPARYNGARLVCTPSLDVAGHPREQFAPAVNCEALLCGVAVVTTTQDAIFEWLRGCPSVHWAKMGDASDLRDVLIEALRIQREEPDVARMAGLNAREWCKRRFSNQAVAAKYAKLLLPIMEGTK